MRFGLIIASVCLFSCNGKDEISVPGGTSTLPSGNNNNDNSGSFNCPSEWTAQDGYDIDPVTCLAWSPLEADIDWYEAVNPNQANSGGCSEYCDNNDINHCADLELGGISSWRLPSIDELEDLSLRSPPLENLDADLWSFNSDTFDGMAWTVNLAQAGMFFTLEKDSLAAARCVAD